MDSTLIIQIVPGAPQDTAGLLGLGLGPPRHPGGQGFQGYGLYVLRIRNRVPRMPDCVVV